MLHTIHKIIGTKTRQRFVGLFVLALGLPFFWTCDDQKNDVTDSISIVSKKEVAEKSISSDPVKPSGEGLGPAASSETLKTAVASAPEAKKAAQPRIYNPDKQSDPFLPLFKEETETSQAAAEQNIPGRIKGPLEKMSLNQLKLVAIVRAPSGDRALVEDRTGKGYILKKGAYIGPNSGVVTQITQNSILIKETSKNLAGETVSQDIKLTLRKPAGGE